MLSFTARCRAEASSPNEREAQVKRKRKREAPAQTILNKLSIDSSVCKDAINARQRQGDSTANADANKVGSQGAECPEGCQFCCASL